jgi:meso-butanediol dehydrogenase / (S,S)-butanediol dehydrogenase / diacetyl reductase
VASCRARDESIEVQRAVDEHPSHRSCSTVQRRVKKTHAPSFFAADAARIARGVGDAPARAGRATIRGDARSVGKDDMSSRAPRIVLITGAARGIGAASARRLAADGARVVLADVDAAGVTKLADELGGVAVAGDVTRADDIARMIEEPYRRWGRLDVLFNNAGVIRVQPLADVTEAEWDRVMAVNLRAVFFVLQAAAARMRTQAPIAGSELRGKLIQTASIAGYRGGNHLMAPYSASKAGVISLTRSAAQALAPDRITSNCVCPGAVDTAMWEQIDRELGALRGWGPREAWRRRTAGIPLGRPETADDVAGVVAFLAGPDSDYMTGQAIKVDGGLVMGD